MLAVSGFAGLNLPSGASAQLFITQPDLKAGPIEPSDPLVGLPLPGATPAEYRANLLWNLRAGLNVAALQCQFSPFLRVVPNYNGILAHHSESWRRLHDYQQLFQTRRRPGQGDQGLRRLFDDDLQRFLDSAGAARLLPDRREHRQDRAAAPKGQLIDVARGGCASCGTASSRPSTQATRPTIPMP